MKCYHITVPRPFTLLQYAAIDDSCAVSRRNVLSQQRPQFLTTEYRVYRTNTDTAKRRLFGHISETGLLPTMKALRKIALTGTFDTDFAARTSSGSQAISMSVPPPTAVAFATFVTKSASNLFRPEITFRERLPWIEGTPRDGIREGEGLPLQVPRLRGSKTKKYVIFQYRCHLYNRSYSTLDQPSLGHINSTSQDG